MTISNSNNSNTISIVQVFVNRKWQTFEHLHKSEIVSCIRVDIVLTPISIHIVCLVIQYHSN